MSKIETLQGEAPVMVDVYLPRIEEDGLVKVDQTVTVYLTNRTGSTEYKIERGVATEVPADVYVQLKNQFPNL